MIGFLRPVTVLKTGFFFLYYYSNFTVINTNYNSFYFVIQVFIISDRRIKL